MSGYGHEPDSRVAHLKRLSRDQLAAFVDGVLEENGAQREATRHSEPEGDEPVTPVAPHSVRNSGPGPAAPAVRSRSPRRSAIDLTRQRDVDTDDASAHSGRR